MLFSKAELESMVRTADRLDQQGLTEEAKQVDLAISRLVEAAKKEEEEESSSFAFSGKQKSALKGLHKAAERADKVFGNKIPKNCRKISNLVDDLLEELAKCDLGE